MKYIFLSIFLLLIGCGKTPQPLKVGSHQLSGGEVESFIHETNEIYTATCNTVEDRTYVFPTREWISGSFAESYKDFLKAVSNTKWTQETFDCDNFSGAAKIWAEILHSSTPNKSVETALAIGKWAYIRDDGQAHSINVFIVFEDNRYKLVFFEPQLQSIVLLSTNELKNTLYFNF